MIKEMQLFFKQKIYILVIVAFLYMLLEFFTAVFPADDSFYRGSLDSDFSYNIEEYSTRNELKEKVDYYHSALVSAKSTPKYDERNNEPIGSLEYKYKLYSILYEEDLKYDEVIEYSGAINEGKHSHFNFFGLFASIVCIFFAMIACSVGSVVPTLDFTLKTAKNVFIKKEKRTVIMFQKCMSSMGLVTFAIIASMIIMALVGLVYIKSGVLYCALAINGNIILINYLQFVVLMICNTIIWCLTIYPVLFYFSLLLKNTIIALLVNMSTFFVARFTMYGSNNRIIISLQDMASHGIMGFCDSSDFTYFADTKVMWLYLFFVVAEMVAIIAGNYALKRFDCTK